MFSSRGKVELGTDPVWLHFSEAHARIAVERELEALSERR
jgi:hypothetical protein